MITPTYIYWLTRCSELKSFFHGLGVLTTVVLVTLTIGMFVITLNLLLEDLNDMQRTMLESIRKRFIKFTLGCCCSAVVCFCLSALIPTTKEAAAICVIPAVANSQAGQKIPDMASEPMDLATEWMKELKPVSKK